MADGPRSVLTAARPFILPISLALVVLLGLAGLFAVSPSGPPGATGSPSPGTTAGPTASETSGATASATAGTTPGTTPSASPRATPSPTPSATPGTVVPPNIVIVMLDDMAPVDQVFQRLPNVKDLFLGHGREFTNFYVNDSLCCPARSTFLTGLYAHHTGVTFNDARFFHPEMTFATQLQAAGYTTLITGKYLNHMERLTNTWPPGWTHAAIRSGGYFDYSLWRDGVEETHGHAPGDYSTDVDATNTIALLQAAPPDKPLLLYFAPSAPHGSSGGADEGQPAVAPRHKRDVQCRDVGFRKTPAYNEQDLRDKPVFLRKLVPLSNPNGWPLVHDCEALLAVDEALGRIRAELTAQGRTDTLFIFTSDNGMAWGDHRWHSKQRAFTTQVPFFVAREGGIADVSGAFISNIDIAPTLAALAGTAMGNYPTGQIAPDGMDVSSLFLGGTTAPARTALLEERLYVTAPPFSEKHPGPAWRAIRTTDQNPVGAWHYIEWGSGQTELYDLDRDPWEMVSRNGPNNVRANAARQILAAQLALMYDAQWPPPPPPKQLKFTGPDD